MNKLLVTTVFGFAFLAPLCGHTKELDGDGRCYMHAFDTGEIVSLNVTTFAELRIEMPFPVYAAKLGGGSLWQATYTRGVPHLWIKSKSEIEQGASTSLTVLDERLNAYDFVIKRVENPGYTCAVVSLYGDDPFTEALSGYQSTEQREVDSLRRQLASARQNYEERVAAVKEHATNVVNASHSAIHAGYTWEPVKRASESREIAESLSSVHDDGFLTFINVDVANTPIYSIRGSHGGDTQIVQVDFNPLLQMYTITGVYDSLLIEGEKGSVQIKRSASE